jgi:hypothetical protein
MPWSLIHSPPLSVQIRRFLENIYLFFGLYFTSFFSVCAHRMLSPGFVEPHLAAEPFN